MVKSPDAFRSIGEVSRLVGVAPHVLRYWEGQFTQLSPVKRADGRRYYRPDDVRLVAGLCQVLREEGLSIRGAKRLITADRGAGLREIGAARLGEGADTTDETPRMRSAAVRLARPHESTPEPAPEPPAENSRTESPVAADDKIESPIQEPARDSARRRTRPAASTESLPLFPGIDHTPPAEWLGRLVTVSAALRGALAGGGALPAKAAQLRERLASGRVSAS